jgi:hypothetical protein
MLTHLTTAAFDYCFCGSTALKFNACCQQSPS